MSKNKNKIKYLKDLKEDDIIYILDLDNIEKGFQKFNVIDTSFEKGHFDDCGCGRELVEDRWFIHFNCPYIDRNICVMEYNKNIVLYRGSYATNVHGKTETKQIRMFLCSDLTGAMEYIRSHYDKEIGYYKKEIKYHNEQIAALQNKILFYSGYIDEYTKQLKAIEKVNEKI